VYQGITRTRFASLQKAAREQLNLNLDADSGSASDSKGANSATWNYDEAKQTLTIQVTKSPFPCFMIAIRMNSYVNSCP
jgi:hypothetical protein